VAPAGGFTPLSKPCSLAFVALNGIAAAMSCVCCAFASATSPLASGGVEDGELSVFRAAALGPESPALVALLAVAFGLVGICDNSLGGLN
jgi:hypothetical protein